MHVINHAVDGVIFKRRHDQMITKCLFLAIEQTREISLAGFSNLRCVVSANNIP